MMVEEMEDNGLMDGRYRGTDRWIYEWTNNRRMKCKNRNIEGLTDGWTEEKQEE